MGITAQNRDSFAIANPSKILVNHIYVNIDFHRVFNTRGGIARNVNIKLKMILSDKILRGFVGEAGRAKRTVNASYSMRWSLCNYESANMSRNCAAIA